MLPLIDIALSNTSNKTAVLIKLKTDNCFHHLGIGLTACKMSHHRCYLSY